MNNKKHKTSVMLGFSQQMDFLWIKGKIISKNETALNTEINSEQ